MKSGANFEDRNAIKRFMEAGATVDTISSKLQIEQQVVAKFVDAFSSKPEEPVEVEDEVEVEDIQEEDKDPEE